MVVAFMNNICVQKYVEPILQLFQKHFTYLGGFTPNISEELFSCIAWEIPYIYYDFVSRDFHEPL